MLRILYSKIGQRRPEDEMPKWASYFDLIPNSKSLVVRNECQRHCGNIFQAVGVALPMTIRKV